MPAIPFIIMGGASVVGSYLQSRGNKKAAEIQAGSDQKALDQAKTIYDTQRQDESPYRQSGSGALNNLNYGLGIPQLAPQTGEPNTPGGPQMPMVRMKAPNGNIYSVPGTQAAEARANGGQLV